MHVGLSELHREQNDLPAATQCLQRGQELGEELGLPQYPYRWCVALARIKEAAGDFNEAIDLLDEAQRLYMSDFSPNVRPIAALKARVWLAQGRLGEALVWAREQGLSAQDELSYGREFEHITLAKVLLARAQNDPAGRSTSEGRT
jgi:LuxR family maltose regulon positive regulatory protein